MTTPPDIFAAANPHTIKTTRPAPAPPEWLGRVRRARSDTWITVVEAHTREECETLLALHAPPDSVERQVTRGGAEPPLPAVAAGLQRFKVTVRHAPFPPRARPEFIDATDPADAWKRTIAHLSREVGAGGRNMEDGLYLQALGEWLSTHSASPSPGATIVPWDEHLAQSKTAAELEKAAQFAVQQQQRQVEDRADRQLAAMERQNDLLAALLKEREEKR